MGSTAWSDLTRGGAGPRGLVYVAALLMSLVLFNIVAQVAGWGQPPAIPMLRQVRVDAEVLEWDPLSDPDSGGCGAGQGSDQQVCGHHLVRYEVAGTEYRARLEVRGSQRFDGDGVRPVVYDRRDPSVVVAGDLAAGGRRGWGELVPMVVLGTAMSGVLVAAYLWARQRGTGGF